MIMIYCKPTDIIIQLCVDFAEEGGMDSITLIDVNLV